MGVGTILIAEAVRPSLEIGLTGRVGLHSLPQAEAFYTRNLNHAVFPIHDQSVSRHPLWTRRPQVPSDDSALRLTLAVPILFVRVDEALRLAEQMLVIHACPT